MSYLKLNCKTTCIWISRGMVSEIACLVDAAKFATRKRSANDECNRRLEVFSFTYGNMIPDFSLISDDSIHREMLSRLFLPNKARGAKPLRHWI